MPSGSTVLHDEVSAERTDESESTDESGDDEGDPREKSLDEIIDAYAE